jgi:predicted metal-dependent phosphoesterase TrpH
MKQVWRPVIVLAAAALSVPAAARDIVKGPIHLRSGSEREWSEFSAESAPKFLRRTFQAASNPIEHTLSVRQRDAKNATWTVSVNGQKLGVLASDERDLRTVFAVPPRVLRDGENLLEIAVQNAAASDDVELSDIRLFPTALDQFLRQSTIVVDTGAKAPVRITVVDRYGALVPLTGLRKSGLEAVRTGVVYTADGRTEIGLPSGGYQVFASHGWDYSAPSQRVNLKPGERRQLNLRLKREVNLPGYISCDTHVHTFELSRHGDASVRERIITAAGEGLDLIVATEHNQTADYSETVRRLGLEGSIQVARGNEVTTPLGHFNIFPLRANAPAPDYRLSDWNALSAAMKALEGVKVVIQNHPRDLHLGYRPFDPAHHLSSAGENLNGRPIFVNAMEVINSGAMYSDMLQLVRDWLGLLNRGYQVAAIGASDTHTVDFVPIGQARTLIRADGAGAAFERLAAGDNLVSYGLAAVLKLETERPMAVTVEVHGPSWSSADRVIVYANGQPVIDQPISPSSAPGLKWSRRLPLNLPQQDVTLVAVAAGPGIRHPFWEVRKPYQPVSKDWTPRVMGISSAVRVDVDGGGFQSPRDYAVALLQQHKQPGPDLIAELRHHDTSVAIQVLTLLAESTGTSDPLGDLFPQQGPMLKNAPMLKKAYDVFAAEWSQVRRSAQADQ